MKDPTATDNVVTKLKADIHGSAQVVAPLINYAETNFHTLEERLRFLALVVFTACQRGNFGPEVTARAIPDACNDIYQELVHGLTPATVH